MPGFLLAAVAPLVLWPIEVFFPYPFLVEEITKYLLSILIVKQGGRVLVGAVLAGMFFGFTETVLYFFNILPTGNSSLLLGRIFLTTPMHILTLFVMTWLGLKGKLTGIVGLLISIAIHYAFNAYLVSLVS